MKVHVYVARGPNCASADFTVPSEDPTVAFKDAKEQAGRLWGEPVDRLAAHKASGCQSRGCNG